MTSGDFGTNPKIKEINLKSKFPLVLLTFNLSVERLRRSSAQKGFD